jgi:GxxExxY protein
MTPIAQETSPQISQIPQIENKSDSRTYAIIGAAMEVHRQLGHGFLESVYQEALGMELVLREVPFRREVELPVIYKGRRLACLYRADFVCFEEIVVELKAQSAITGVDRSQTLNYLKATQHTLGLLFNFGGPSLEWQRLILTDLSLRESAQSADSSS